jgi:uncharacterized protein (DUF433 family)
MTTHISTHELISRWLEADPAKPGPADWRVKGHRLPVWRILRQFALEKGMDSPEKYWGLVLSLGLDDPLIAAIAQYYDVPAKAIQAAIAYSHNPNLPDLMAARLMTAKLQLANAQDAD